MAIIIKEIQVKTTIERNIQQEIFVTDKLLRQLKQLLVREMESSCQFRNKRKKER
jgi:hypothetical protein